MNSATLTANAIHHPTIDYRAGTASLQEAKITLNTIFSMLDYQRGMRESIKSDTLKRWDKLTHQELKQAITQNFVIVHNCIGAFLSERQPARDSKDYLARLNNGFERLYGELDDIETKGVSLGRVCIYLAELERHREDLLEIKAELEAQDDTRDMLEEVG